MLIRTFIAATLVFGAAADAAARAPRAAARAAAPLAPLTLDDSLRALPFGQPPEAAIRWVQARLTAINGPSEQGQFKTLAAVAALRRSKIAFNRSSRALDDTVVGQEFAHGNAESALVWQEKPGKTHYLFFHHDRLYKYARPVAAAPTFVERVQQLIGKMGKPSAVIPFDGDAERIAHATWEHTSRTLRLTDHHDRFGADLLVIESAQLAHNVAVARAAGGQGAQPDVSDELREFLEVSGQ